MRKLTLAFALPGVHVVTYLEIFGWTLHSWREPGAATELWFAVNGPVFVLLDVCRWVAATIPISRYVPDGTPVFYQIFLVGGIALWFCVGLAIRSPQILNHGTSPLNLAPRILANLVVFVIGVRLFPHAIQWLSPEYPGAPWVWSEVVAGGILLSWALLLTLGTSWKLLGAIRVLHASQKAKPAP